jgi:small subunit ribosomal protein S8
MRHDTVADMFSNIKNAEAIGKKSCITPASKLIKNMLLIMQKKGYIGDFEFVDNGKGGLFRIELTGKINDCGVIKPRSPVRRQDFIGFEKRFLPANGMGILIVSTPKGVTSHGDAKKKETGGRLLGYVY